VGRITRGIALLLIYSFTYSLFLCIECKITNRHSVEAKIYAAVSLRQRGFLVLYNYFKFWSHVVSYRIVRDVV